MMKKIDPMLQAMLLQAKRNAVREADVSVVTAYFAFSVLAARDEFGFGKERCQRFAQKLFNTLDSYDKGLLSVQDAYDTLEDETGFDLLNFIISHRDFGEKGKAAMEMHEDYLKMKSEQENRKRQEKKKASKNASKSRQR